MENINEALMLMVVGMGTVFVALLLVIFCNKGLIYLLNRFLPEETPVPAVVQKTAEIPSKVVAAITAAVNKVSGGKAKIEKIERIKHN